ncbi:MAG: bifunctional (p)ppGpp synthetase/guanosine-3',5'-bis(diphosphate) 3'-pyrophosphohydrolase [Candidatus Pacebacteria bacterium]|nr:bifunctional (p)ppGpp synthetase/guanosine-3',5'-bis(diphosphate) 3'-pyrophosphohydrolase [Candidatus Paceibacterota bacterium]
MTSVEEILAPADYLNKEQKELIKRAFYFALGAHEGQTRFSGEAYIIHPIAVAQILIELRADAETIAAALLHDTVEDTPVIIEEIEKKFGKNIAFLVDGVTKLGKLKYQGLERHVESLRKLFVAMAKDLRVILIRLADRLHNVRTLEHVRPDKQERIAVETLEIYAPLANRLGIWKLKGQLEDAAFPYAYPEEFKEVNKLRKTKGKESLRKLEKIYRTLSKELAIQNIKDAHIDYRIKYLYSLYLKLKRHHMDMSQIYDLSALRVIVPTLPDCYQTLGIIHSLWKPVPGRLKDYIAHPKMNGYQSIHTAIFLSDGTMAEIQIRSKKMHEAAEYGFASHLLYDETGKPKNGGKATKKVAWLQDLIEWQKQVEESGQFLADLKNDFFQDRIFTFTPKGDVIELPKGATALDFAYAIHSDIGEHAAGATVNNKFVAMDTALKSHDLVQIEVKKTTHPSPKWLSIVRTSMARKHIKNYLLKEERKK